MNVSDRDNKNLQISAHNFEKQKSCSITNIAIFLVQKKCNLGNTLSQPFKLPAVLKLLTPVWKNKSDRLQISVH